MHIVDGDFYSGPGMKSQMFLCHCWEVICDYLLKLPQRRATLRGCLIDTNRPVRHGLRFIFKINESGGCGGRSIEITGENKK